MVVRAGRIRNLEGLLGALLGCASLIAGGWLAAHHPLHPAAILGAFLGWCALAAVRPGWWLAVLPALLPLANFSPWTGWIAVDEFDLLVLGAAAAGHGVRAWRSASNEPRGWQPWHGPALVLGASLAIGLIRGALDAGLHSPGWFDGYADPGNTWRVAKSGLWVLLLAPLMADELAARPQRAVRRLSLGMALGLAVVCLAAVWERTAQPGLLDFSAHYRTVALFWEMHVGGAALDAYLALATPFAAWALWQARTPGRWAMAAALALLVAYTVLTSYARGAYVSVGVPLLLLGGALWAQRHGVDLAALLRRLLPVLLVLGGAVPVFAAAIEAWGYGGAVPLLIVFAVLLWLPARHRRGARWRGTAAGTLALAIVFEAVAVLGAQSFMKARLDDSDRDFGSRVEHWQHGLGLLDGPADALFGLGLGRLPTHYAATGGRQREWPGSVSLRESGDGSAVRLSGPEVNRQLGGLFALTQRVPLVAGARHRFAIDVEVDKPVRVIVGLCEMHLLYERRCQAALLRLQPGASAVQHLEGLLGGPPLDPGAWYAPRQGVFALSVLTPGAHVDLHRVGLQAQPGDELLHNGRFTAGLARWFPAAQFYFLPWHIDNLYLELLIERGAFGLLAVAAWMGWALWRLLIVAPASAQPFALFVAASLAGGLSLGLVSSLMDVPRVAFLFLLLALFGMQLGSSPAAVRRKT